MPARLSHVVVLTEDLDSYSRILVEVVGMTAADEFRIDRAQLSEVFGWTEASSTRAKMHGEGPGSVELVEIPKELRGEVSEGIGFLTFLNRDSAAAQARATEAGLHTRGPVSAPNPTGGEISCSFVSFAGVEVELVQVLS